MSKKVNKQSYLTHSDCLKIIEYSNDLLSILAESFRHQDCDDFIVYQRKYYNFKELFICFITSFIDENDKEL